MSRSGWGRKRAARTVVLHGGPIALPPTAPMGGEASRAVGWLAAGAKRGVCGCGRMRVTFFSPREPFFI